MLKLLTIFLVVLSASGAAVATLYFAGKFLTKESGAWPGEAAPRGEGSPPNVAEEKRAGTKDDERCSIGTVHQAISLDNVSRPYILTKDRSIGIYPVGTQRAQVFFQDLTTEGKFVEGVFLGYGPFDLFLNLNKPVLVNECGSKFYLGVDAVIDGKKSRLLLARQAEELDPYVFPNAKQFPGVYCFEPYKINSNDELHLWKPERVILNNKYFPDGYRKITLRVVYHYNIDDGKFETKSFLRHVQFCKKIEYDESDIMK